MLCCCIPFPIMKSIGNYLQTQWAMLQMEYLPTWPGYKCLDLPYKMICFGTHCGLFIRLLARLTQRHETKGTRISIAMGGYKEKPAVEFRGFVLKTLITWLSRGVSCLFSYLYSDHFLIWHGRTIETASDIPVIRQSSIWVVSMYLNARYV